MPPALTAMGTSKINNCNNAHIPRTLGDHRQDMQADIRPVPAA
jgi:hypothetical protein